MIFPLLVSTSHISGKEKIEESLKKVLQMGFDPTTSKFLDALRIVHSFSHKTIEENINVYTRLGFSVHDVWEIFKKEPMFLVCSEKKINQRFETLEKCGLLKHEVLLMVKKFPPCIGISEQNILNSVETFLGLGFSRDEFAMVVKRLPQVLGLSAETVKKKTEFVVKQMDWPLKSVVMFPPVLGLSLEKRIVPRCNVMKALLSEGLLVNGLPSMGSVLACTNETFLHKYVRKHDEKQLVAELMNLFTGKTGKTYEGSERSRGIP